MKALFGFAVAFLMVLGLAQQGSAESTRYSAHLSGGREVPAVRTEATGEFKLTVFPDGSLTFRLHLHGVSNPLAAYIHQGKRSENGPPVVGLFGGPPRVGEVNGLLAEGSLTEKNFLGQLQGKRTADLLRLIDAGEAYVNVITSTFPTGEIRGQIE